MPDIVVFTQQRGTERVYVAERDVDWWIAFYGRGGVPACRLRDYRRWGGFWPRLTDRDSRAMWGSPDRDG